MTELLILLAKAIPLDELISNLEEAIMEYKTTGEKKKVKNACRFA